MTLKEFIVTEAPKRLGKNRNCELAGKIYDEEISGNELFSAKYYENVRDRISMLFPYCPAPGKEKEFEHCLNIVEAAALTHYINDEKHFNDADDLRLHNLMTSDVYTDEEIEIINQQVESWWLP